MATAGSEFTSFPPDRGVLRVLLAITVCCIVVAAALCDRLPALFLLLVVVGNVVSRHAARRRLVQDLVREHPWLPNAPVARVAAHHVAALQQTLCRRRVRVLAVDAAGIRSAADLAEALAAVLGGIQYPTDPDARIAALIGFEMRGCDAPSLALFVRGADRLAEQAPDVWARFVERWTSASLRAGRAMLLFLTAGEQPADVRAGVPAAS